MVKAIFFDIDGTLVSFNTHRIPESTMEAVRKVQEKGIKVFIATGRTWGHIDNLEGLSFDGYITLNGGYCLNAKEQVIYKNGIHAEDIDLLIRYQQEKETFPCVFMTENEIFVNYINEDVTRVFKMIDVPEPPERDIREAVGQDILQVMAFFGQDREAEIMENVFRRCESARWNPLFSDVIAKENSKRTGIDKMIAHYGIDLAETMSFGDGGNDIPMLQHAAIGVAMGNATDQVKQHADYVTDSVDENGIWNALKYFEII